jgi:hypothetical protein
VNSSWNHTGISFIDTNHNLSHPRSVFVDRHDAVHASFAGNGIVISWMKNNNSPSKIYYGNYSDTNLSNLHQALKDFFTELQAKLKELCAYVSFWDVFDLCNAKADVSNSLFIDKTGDIYVGNDEKKCIDK